MVEPTVLETLLFEFSKLLQWIFNSALLFLNTPLGLTLIGTSFAAFAGVYGAHTIIERNKRREELLREIRITNAAIMVSFEICNSYLALKNQHVKDMGLRHAHIAGSLEEFNKGRRSGQIGPEMVFEFPADFMILNPMKMPGEILVKQVFEQISASAKVCTLTNTLIRSMDSLNLTITQRNELINTWKTSPEVLGNNLIRFYLGLPDPAGHVDRSFPDSIEGICSLTDDCIQFSKMLCDDLSEHGERLNKRLGKDVPKINKPEWANAVDLGLMPDPKNYEDWNKMFVKHKDQKKENR